MQRWSGSKELKLEKKKFKELYEEETHREKRGRDNMG
jgi:hypothetical protein